MTGAGNGLGRAISIALSHAGARTLLVGRNRDKLDSVAMEIGGDVRVGVCDTSSEASVRALSETFVDENISILANNAGIAGPVAPLVDIGAADWDDVFAVNVRGMFLMCRAFLPPMIVRGAGEVINIASVSGKRPLARRTPYAASKMAVLGLTTTLAHEVGPLGVVVNSLSPGPVRGPRMARNFALEGEVTGGGAAGAEEEFVSRAALHRMVTEEEVAAAVLAMLAMPGLCGADIDLSAGMTARINEAFAVQVLGSADALKLDEDKLNVNGGAIALGNPFGTTGARITGTLMNNLRSQDKTIGLETMCVGGGQGHGAAIERLAERRPCGSAYSSVSAPMVVL